MPDLRTTIYEKVASGNLLDAISILRKEISSGRDPKSIDALERTESTYRYMLKYMREGHADPSRRRVANDVAEDILDIADRYMQTKEAENSPLLFHTQSRLVGFSGLHFPEALGRLLTADATLQLSDRNSSDYKEALSAKNMALKDIFSIVWTMPAGNERELKEIINVASDDDISFSLRGTIVGALILALMRSYDRARLKALLSIESRTGSERLRARVLTGIALTLDRHSGRIAKDENMRERFESLSDNLTFYTRMREVVYSLVKARGGIKFLDKMKNEIIPDIRKFGPGFLDRLKDESGEINIERLEDNPEWENMLKESGMEKKLRRLNNMQSSGADMMLSMFEQVSRNFLFNDIDTWFRPFEEWEAERLGMPQELAPVMEAFCLNPGICDSDKFAMISNLQRIPESARSLLRNTFEAQTSQLSEEMKEMMLHTSSPEFDMECYNFARTLFRFFSFFRLRKEFYNPFLHLPQFYRWPFIGGMLGEREIMTSVGEYCFTQGFYSDSASVFKSLAHEAGESITDEDDRWKTFCLQKAASSYERMGDVTTAIEEFERAFEMSPSDEWLARKIVGLTLNNGRDLSITGVNALRFLHESDKDNIDYLLPLIRHYIRSANESDRKEADRLMPRAVYIDPANAELLRMQDVRLLAGIDGKEADSSRLDEALAMIAPLLYNATMYLASASLGGGIADSNALTSGEADEIRGMSTDLALGIYLEWLKGNVGAALGHLRNFLALQGDDVKPDAPVSLLSEYFGNALPESALEALRSELPLMRDALASE